MVDWDLTKRRYSELYDHYMHTDDYLFGLVVNSLFVIVGGVLYWFTSFPTSFIGFGIALWGLWNIVKWVMGA